MPAPDSSGHDSVAGYSGRVGCSNLYESGFVCLHVLRFVGNVMVPVIERFPNWTDKDPYSTAMSLFMDGIRVDPERAQPLKTKIEIRDLIGEWTTSSDSSVIYVDTFGGCVGVSFVAHGTRYVIAADGSYHMYFAGTANGRIVRDNEHGKVEIRDNFIVFRDTKTNHTDRYRWISTQLAPNGATVMKLMPGHYEPTGANSRFYGEMYVRAGQRK